MPTPNTRRTRMYVGSGAVPTAPRPRMSPDLMATLAMRLTNRDRWLLEILYEHRVLTTTQIQQLAFPSISTTTHRLLKLWQLRAVERFRPPTDLGSAPMHYVLGPAGASILAERRGKTVAQLGYRLDHTLAIAHSDKLNHLVGSNGIFTALAAHARTTPGTDLTVWWSERRCRTTWGKYARPDGYGQWHQDGHAVDFFLEYDTGTEPIRRLLAKLSDYRHLAEMTGISNTPVVFALPGSAREEHLHAHLNASIPWIATTTSDTLLVAGGPEGATWRPGGAIARRRLIDLVWRT